MESIQFENPHAKEAWIFLQARLKEAGVEASIDPEAEMFQFKTGEDNTEVMKLPLIFKFSLASLDNVLNRLEAVTTNDRINDEIYKQVELLNKLGTILPNIDIDSIKTSLKPRAKDGIDTGDLFRKISQADVRLANELMNLGFFDNEMLYNTRTQLREILGGERQVNVNMAIVYKRITGAEIQIQREIDYYRKFEDAGINTFCAFTFKYIDSEGGAYDFTKFEGDLTTIANANRLFESRKGQSLFRIILDELLKAHTHGLMHGDLHFKNVGFVEDDDGKYIILFDLVRASSFNPEDKGLTQKFIGELTNFGRSVLSKAEDLARSPEMKVQIKEDLEYYLNSLSAAFPALDIELIRSFCFSDLYAYLG